MFFLFSRATFEKTTRVTYTTTTTTTSGSSGAPIIAAMDGGKAAEVSKASGGPPAVNDECAIINGMSQGDRLQQIKSLRRHHHLRATTTGALK